MLMRTWLFRGEAELKPHRRGDRAIWIFVLLPHIFSVSLFTQTQSTATLYVYRNNATFGSTLKPPVYSDGVEVARIADGRFVKVEIQPGKHTLVSDDKRSALELHLEPGREYFVRVDIASGLLRGHGKLAQPPVDQARSEIKHLKLLDPIKDHQQVVSTKAWTSGIVVFFLYAFAVALTFFMSALAEWRPQTAFQAGRRAVTTWMLGMCIFLPIGYLIQSGRLSLPMAPFQHVARFGWFPLLPIGAGLMWRPRFPKLGFTAIGVRSCCLAYFVSKLLPY